MWSGLRPCLRCCLDGLDSRAYQSAPQYFVQSRTNSRWLGPGLGQPPVFVSCQGAPLGDPFPVALVVPLMALPNGWRTNYEVLDNHCATGVTAVVGHGGGTHAED